MRAGSSNSTKIKRRRAMGLAPSHFFGTARAQAMPGRVMMRAGDAEKRRPARRALAWYGSETLGPVPRWTYEKKGRGFVVPLSLGGTSPKTPGPWKCRAVAATVGVMG